MDTCMKDMLADMGITDPESQESAIKDLIRKGVISGRRKRTNIAITKLKRVESCLQETFSWHCRSGDCKRAAKAATRPPLLVAKSHCAYCGGSADRRSLKKMSETLDALGSRRILVLGGTSRVHQEIERKSRSLRVEWRFIEGTKAKDDRYYRPHRDWADIIVIWSSTPLDHRVSRHFTGRSDDRVITAERRGISSFCQSVISHIRH